MKIVFCFGLVVLICGCYSMDFKFQPQSRSLLIVFDVSISMTPSLDSVKEASYYIINDVISKEINPIEDYIVVPFADPWFGPAQRTKDPKEFLRMIDDLKIKSGSAVCPEMSLSALNMGLELAKPESFVYIFTDADPKDPYMMSKVMDNAQEKRITLKFIIANAKCNGRYPSKDKFIELADNTNGEVYTVELKETLPAIKDLTSDILEGATIFDMVLSEPGNRSLEVNVDSTITFLKASLTGDNPTLRVIDPNNKVSDKARVVLDLDRVKTVYVDSPEPGVWRIETSSSSKNQVKVSGNSKVSFKYGFSLHKPESLEDTGAYPFNSHSNYLALACSDPLVALEDIRVFTHTTDKTVALKSVDYSNISICAFDPPKEAFKVEVIGKDGNGNKIKRLLPTRFYLKNVTKPQFLGDELEQYLTIAPQNNQDLDCIMAGDPEPKMKWYKNGKQLEVTRNVLTVDNEEAEYKCIGENDFGSASVRFHVNKGQAPEVVESRLKDKNGSIVLFNGDSTDYLICPVKSHPKATVSWFKDDEPVSEKTLPGVHFEADGQVISFRGLDNHPTNMGLFRCLAENKKGSISLHFRVEFNEAPRIHRCEKYDFDPDSNTYLEKVFVQRKGQAELDCDITGNPRPEISWFKKVNPIDSDREKIAGNKRKLKVSSFKNHAVYICGARNTNGYLEKHFQVDIKSAPKLKNPLDENMEVALHSAFTIKCDTEYEVDVKVKWLKNETEIISNKRYNYSKDRLRLKVVGASAFDEAFYKCSLSNSDGKAVKGFNVTLIKVATE